MEGDAIRRSRWFHVKISYQDAIKLNIASVVRKWLMVDERTVSKTLVCAKLYHDPNPPSPLQLPSTSNDPPPPRRMKIGSRASPPQRRLSSPCLIPRLAPIARAFTNRDCKTTCPPAAARSSYAFMETTPTMRESRSQFNTVSGLLTLFR